MLHIARIDDIVSDLFDGLLNGSKLCRPGKIYIILNVRIAICCQLGSSYHRQSKEQKPHVNDHDDRLRRSYSCLWSNGLHVARFLCADTECLRMIVSTDPTRKRQQITRGLKC